MIILMLQTAALLFAAYILGAISGCWLRRRLAPQAGDSVPMAFGIAELDDPMIEVAAGPEPRVPALTPANRFERALVGPRAARPYAVQAVPAPEPEFTAVHAEAAPPLPEAGQLERPEPIYAEPEPTPPSIETVEDQIAVETAAADTAAPESPAKPAEGIAAPEIMAAGVPTATAPPPESAPPPILPAAGGTGGVSVTSAPLPVQQSADDLTRIRGIDAETAAQLPALGVTSYERLAAFTAADVARVETSLGDRRIARENWIEQAQLLASGRATAFARAHDGEEPVLPPADEVYGVTQIAGTGDAHPETDASPDEAVDSTAEPVLSAPGDYAPAIEVPEIEPVEAHADAVVPAVLETTEDAVASDIVVAETDTNAMDGESESAEISAAPIDEPVTASASPLDAVDGAPVQTGPAEPPASGDDLTHIRGIDANTAALLADNGATRFADIASWSAEDVNRFGDLLGTPGRIARENWIEQAQLLASRGETLFSRRRDSFPAVVAQGEPPSHLAGFRSVRSPVLTGSPAKDVAPPDNLKRIRGIGLLIEKKLNALGVYNYGQIANWTAAEVDRISQMLDFKGRIERECWIEQARILASGGLTQFASRIDRE